MWIIIKSWKNGCSLKDKHTIIKLKKELTLEKITEWVSLQWANIKKIYQWTDWKFKIRIDKRINEDQLNKFIS